MMNLDNDRDKALLAAGIGGAVAGGIGTFGSILSYNFKSHSSNTSGTELMAYLREAEDRINNIDISVSYRIDDTEFVRFFHYRGPAKNAKLPGYLPPLNVAPLSKIELKVHIEVNTDSYSETLSEISQNDVRNTGYDHFEFRMHFGNEDSTSSSPDLLKGTKL